MKVTEMWKSGSRPTVSFELFPARSEKAAESLGRAMDSLAKLGPDFVSVTFGAGGTTREGSRQLLEELKRTRGFEVVGYFACYGLGPDEITAVLDSYKQLGMENILAVRGDPPKEGDVQPHPESFSYAADMLSFIRPTNDFCIGVAGYPEGQIEAPSKEKDIEVLKVREGEGGTIMLGFSSVADRARAIEILGELGFPTRIRD